MFAAGTPISRGALAVALEGAGFFAALQGGRTPFGSVDPPGMNIATVIDAVCASSPTNVLSWSTIDSFRERDPG